MNNKRIFLSPPDIRGNELKYIEEAFAQNYIAPLGPMVDRFEMEFAKETKLSHTLALSSGTAALHLALKIAGVEKEDTVICSDLTFIGGVSPILFLGASPVFIDSNPKTWNMDPNLLEDAITNLKQMPKAIILTHIYGIPAEIDEIVAIADKHDIPIIEDCAESLGATYKGKPLGYAGLSSIFSFNGNKIITTSGGGMLASNDLETISRAKFYSTQAREDELHYEHREIGFNYRMSNVLAGIGVAQLEDLAEKIAIRKKIFERYKKELSIDGISFMPIPSYGEANYWLTCILLDPKKISSPPATICKRLDELNIEVRPTWKPMHMQPVFEKAQAFTNGTNQQIFEQGLCLPSGSGMKDEDITRVISGLKQCID